MQDPKPKSAAPSVTAELAERGHEAMGYRWAFNTFAVLFLLTLIVGLVNYIGTWIKYRVG